MQKSLHWFAAAAVKSLLSGPTLCDSISGSPPGSSVHRILYARILEWVAISISIHWLTGIKKMELLSIFISHLLQEGFQ